MVEPISLSIAIGLLVKSAPGWFHSLEDTFLNQGKELAIDQGKQRLISLIDAKKHLRHMELALQNAAERGLKQFHTLEERDQYRSILEILSEPNSETLRQEVMSLFTLSDNPDLSILTEKYNLSQRIHALAQHEAHVEVDATPYLNSFFEALIAEMYNDPLFQEQISDVIKVRGVLKGQRSLEDIVAILSQITGILTNNYSPEQFKQDLGTYVKYIENKFRHHKFAGIVFRGDEDTAPELKSIFVPLHVTLQKKPLPKNETEDDIVTLLEQSPYLVLLGGPGSGKSTTTRYISWSHAKANLTMPSVSTQKNRLLLLGKPIPLRIELRLLSVARRQRADYSFLSYTTEVMLGREDISINSQMFKELLERRAMLLLFDGLDEVPTLDERRQLIEEIESFAQRYPGNRILVTSRPVGYEIARFANRWFQHSLIHEFNDRQIHSYLEAWYTHVLKYSPLPADVRQELESFYTTLKDNSRLHKLAANPLLLTVMTALHRYKRLPDKRVQVYEECADLLLDTWAKLKHEGTRWKDMKMGKENQIACIAHLGYVLHKRSQEKEVGNTGKLIEDTELKEDVATDVPAKFMLREIERFLKNQKLLSGAEQGAEAELFLELARAEAGLIVERGTDEEGEALYGFVHRTFQEYFAAVDVYERYQQEDDSSIISKFLNEHLHHPHWREVILLLFGKLKHKQATIQLRRILEGKSRLSKYSHIVQHDLFFVCSCLAEEITVENDFAEFVVVHLRDLIKETPFSLQRKEAMEALGTIMQTRQYADLGRRNLEILITENNVLDISTKILAVLILYNNSRSKEEQLQVIEMLRNVILCFDFPFEETLQAIESFFNHSSTSSEELRQASQLLLQLTQRPNLSLEQKVRAIELAYYHSPTGSEELRQASQLLLQLIEQPDLSFEQSLQVVGVLYWDSPTGSTPSR